MDDDDDDDVSSSGSSSNNSGSGGGGGSHLRDDDIVGIVVDAFIRLAVAAAVVDLGVYSYYEDFVAMVHAPCLAFFMWDDRWFGTR